MTIAHKRKMQYRFAIRESPKRARLSCGAGRAMKLIALEEHYCTASVREAWMHVPLEWKDDSIGLFKIGDVEKRLEDLSQYRLAQMDEMGIDIQVLSLTLRRPSPSNLPKRCRWPESAST